MTRHGRVEGDLDDFGVAVAVAHGVVGDVAVVVARLRPATVTHSGGGDSWKRSEVRLLLAGSLISARTLSSRSSFFWSFLVIFTSLVDVMNYDDGGRHDASPRRTAIIGG